MTNTKRMLCPEHSSLTDSEYWELTGCLKCMHDEYNRANQKPSTDASAQLNDSKLIEALERIARTDVSDTVPDFLWLQKWRHDTKELAKHALEQYRKRKR